MKWRIAACALMLWAGAAGAGPIPANIVVEGLTVSYLPGTEDIGTLGISGSGTGVIFTPAAFPPGTGPWTPWHDSYQSADSRFVASVRVTDIASGDSETVTIDGYMYVTWGRARDWTGEMSWDTKIYGSRMFQSGDPAAVTLGRVEYEIGLGYASTSREEPALALFTVRPVPEPATVTMLAFGGSTLLAARRRKTKTA